MRSGGTPMWFFSDRSGFPWVGLPELCLEAQLLPVTKLQGERFIVEANAYGDVWYEEILTWNPRVSYRGFDPARREHLFLGAVQPDEGLDYARWLGPDFDLPTVDEWRALYRALEGEAVPLDRLERVLEEGVSLPARCILEQLLDQLQPRSLLDLSLMRGGLVEWARQDGEWVGLGAPRPEVWAHLWDPLEDVIRPSRRGERLRYFGFRLVRRVQ